MAFRRSNLPKPMENFILGAEKVNTPDEEAESAKGPDPAVLNSPAQVSEPKTADDLDLAEFEKKPIRPFRKKGLASFRELENTRQIHQLQIRFTERDWEMLNYCMRIGDEKSKQKFVTNAIRVAMAELIRAQEME